MKKIMSFLFILMCFFGLCSCGNSGNDEADKSEPVTLSSLENKTYNCLVNTISEFNNPSSVTVVSLKKVYWDEKMIVLRLSAENKVGGTVTNDYIMMLESLEITSSVYDEVNLAAECRPIGTNGFVLPQYVCYDLSNIGNPYENDEYRTEEYYPYIIMWNVYTYGTASTNSYDFSVAKLNSKLEEYKTSMGWN